jgi:hypothetical protein
MLKIDIQTGYSCCMHGNWLNSMQNAEMPAFFKKRLEELKAEMKRSSYNLSDFS